MSEHVVLECPICEQQKPYDPSEASTDRFVEAVGAHIFAKHPSTRPGKAETLIERAVENAEIIDIDDGVVTIGSWDHHGL